MQDIQMQDNANVTLSINFASTVNNSAIETESEEELILYLLLGLFGIFANTIFLIVVCGFQKYRR